MSDMVIGWGGNPWLKSRGLEKRTANRDSDLKFARSGEISSNNDGNTRVAAWIFF